MFQIHVGVVASSTSKPRIFGIVPTAVEQAIRLETHIVDATEVGHHRHGVHCPMARLAKFLGKGFGIKFFGIENVHVLSGGGEHDGGVAPSRAVAGFAGHAGNQTIQLKFGVDHCGCAVATEAVPRFIAVDVAARCLFKTGRRIEDVSDRPVQSIDRRVIAYATFVEFSVAPVDVSLGHMRMAESVEYRLADRLFSVGYAVHALLAVAYDLVRVRSGSKSHPWMGSQHIAFGSNT